MSRVIASHVFCALLILGGLGCVTDVAKNSERAEIQAFSGPGATMRLERPLTLSLRSGFSVPVIHENTTWREVGSISQGRLFKAVDSVLMVDAGHLYDAYLVVNQKDAVGVYLPGDSAFVAARQPVTHSLVEVSR